MNRKFLSLLLAAIFLSVFVSAPAPIYAQQPEATLLVHKDFEYCTEGNSVENMPIITKQGWFIFARNELLPTLENVIVEAVPGFTLTGSTVPPDEIVGSTYRWLLGSIPERQLRMIGLFEPELASPIEPGFTSSREADITEFSAPGYQTLTVTVIAEREFYDIELLPPPPLDSWSIETDELYAIAVEGYAELYDEFGVLIKETVFQVKPWGPQETLILPDLDPNPPNINIGDRIVATIKFFVVPKDGPVDFMGHVRIMATTGFEGEETSGYKAEVDATDFLGETLSVTMTTTTYVGHLFQQSTEANNVVYMAAAGAESLHGVVATIDFDPDALNLKSNGEWVTVYIELPPGFDVAGIDASTVLLNGVVPAVTDRRYGWVKNPKSYLMDHDSDGILERMVKFKRADVKGILSVGKQVLIEIMGLVNGIPFVGWDTIRVK